MQEIRVTTLFSGYDSQCLALNRLKENYPEFDYELVAWCEIEKSACVAHDALFPQWADRNIGDIAKVDANSLPDCDLMTWSFPCTDISQSGKQAGLQENSGTRSSLAWEAIRLFRAKKPKYLLMENVAALVSSKFIKDFHKILSALEEIGYANFAQILDSRDYGVAQHRPRIFLVSIRVDDEDNPPKFYFPKPFPLEKRLKDYLEDEVDEKYYLSDERVQGLITSTQKESERGNGFAWNPTDGSGVACTIQTTQNRKTDNYLFDTDEYEEVYPDKHGQGW